MGPRETGRGGSRTPGLLRGGRSPLNTTACTEYLKLPTAWRAEPAQCEPAARRTKPSHSPFAQRTPRLFHVQPARRTKSSRRPFAQRTVPASAPQQARSRSEHSPPLKRHRYPIVIRLALPPAAAVFTLSERSISRRSSSRLVSPRAKPCTDTIAPSRAAICSHRVRS